MKRIQQITNHLQPTTNSSLQPQLCTGNTENNKTVSHNKVPEQFGGKLAAQAIKEQGVTHVFTLTGGHIAPILVGCNQLGLRVIDVRDEATTVFAADAYARSSGIPGIAIVTAGPGLTNTITPVKNAQMAESPLIIFGGATAILLKGRGSLQDIDQFALMKPHVKMCYTIKKVNDIIPTIRNAFSVALSDVPGPVFIEFPIETIWPMDQVVSMTGSKNQSKLEWNKNSIKNYIGNRYQEYHLNKVFDHAYDNIPPLRKLYNNLYNLSLNDIDLKNILHQLEESKYPLILIGSQGLNPNIISKLISSIETINIPVYLSGMARGLLGAKHRLLYRHKRAIALKACDFIILSGISMDFRIDYGRSINNKAYIVMCNLDYQKLKQNSDIKSKNLTIHGDPIALLIRLAEMIERLNIKREYPYWIRTLTHHEEEREKEIDKMAAAPSKLYVNPVKCCRILDELIDDDSYIIADGGDFVGTASYIVKPRKPLRWLDPGPFGTLGCGAGFAIGVKSLNPKSEVWIIYGDGSFGWTCMEFDTYVRMKLPIIAIIGNDACWSQMYRDQIRLLKDPVATLLEYTHYEKVVEGFGGIGILVQNENELKPAIEKAKLYVKEGKSVCINVLLSKSTFREGSLSL